MAARKKATPPGGSVEEKARDDAATFNIEHRDAVLKVLQSGDETLLDTLQAETGLDDVQARRALAAVTSASLGADRQAGTILPPEPREGYGLVLAEAPLDVVKAFANLHPSEKGTVAAQMAGKMREVLMETRKMPPYGAPVEEGDPDLAMLTTGELDAVVDTDEDA